jgi:hypothetical protein
MDWNVIIIQRMEPRFFHGSIRPAELARALLAQFNDGNLHAQAVGSDDKIVVQVATDPQSASGGHTALAVSIDAMEDGVMVRLGEQAWLGLAASLGTSAIAALRNPLNLLGRLDDIAQDLESLRLSERIWTSIELYAAGVGASSQLSERLRRTTCEYCRTANPIGEPACLACGAPMGGAQPRTCSACGFVVLREEIKCPNCGTLLPR